MIRALLFDWGDTLMRVLPEETGPIMAHWSRVEAIPGAELVLRTLRASYRIALATNGGAAGVPLVRKALARARLDEYLEEIFTAQDLGARKPDTAFFLALLGRLGVRPHEAVMVGDSYAEDVVGAKRAGLSAVWWNERRRVCPDPCPLYDAELLEMRSLPQLLSTPFLPDVDACLALLQEQGATEGFLARAQAVARVACGLAFRLRERGESIDPLLAHRGALLHDLGRAGHGPNRSHEGLAAGLPEERGFPALARIARRHTICAFLDERAHPTTWEERLVFYADSVVAEDTIVGVTRRAHELCRRHPGEAERLAHSLPSALALDAEIARRLGVAPSELVER